MFTAMSTVLEIESAIEKLPPHDQLQLRNWLQAGTNTQPSVLQKLLSLADTGRNLPADLAANHDHYLHDTPKRS